MAICACCTRFVPSEAQSNRYNWTGRKGLHTIVMELLIVDHKVIDDRQTESVLHKTAAFSEQRTNNGQLL